MLDCLYINIFCRVLFRHYQSLSTLGKAGVIFLSQNLKKTFQRGFNFHRSGIALFLPCHRLGSHFYKSGCFLLSNENMLIEQNSGDSVKTLENVNHFLVAVLEYSRTFLVPSKLQNFKIIATSNFSVLTKAGVELVIYIFRETLTMLLFMVLLLQLTVYGSTVSQKLDQVRLNLCIFFM